jgi:hypothetical protein
MAAMDAAPDGGAASSPLAAGPRGVVVMRNVLPDWAVRMLVGTALLPALLTALDAFFRARRRGLQSTGWLVWLAVAAAPVLVAWLWCRLLGLTGALQVPGALVPPGTIAAGTGGAIALGSVPVVAGLAWLGLRPFGRAARRGAGSPAAGGLAAAAGLVLALAALLAWVADPYLALLLLPAAHAWLFAAAPRSRMPPALAALSVLAGLILPLLVVAYYVRAFAAGPLALSWLALLGTAAGHVSVPTLAVAAGFAAALAATVRVVAARRRIDAAAPPPPIRTRGPVSYAGPGSLGGTESALRR